VEVVKLLRDAGADINRPANDESTPLSAAAYNGRLAVVKILKEAGANVNKRGETQFIHHSSCLHL
jgi:ankyrin repeat protein